MSAEEAAGHWFDLVQLSSLGDGHIHDTYLVCTADNDLFVLQRVNHEVFRDPHMLMAQTTEVLEHWSMQTRYKSPELVAARDGSAGKWINGKYWRAWRYIADTTVVDPLRRPEQAYAAGAAFGAMQHTLASLKPDQLRDPIEGFLQLDYYLRAYDQVAGEAPADLHHLVEEHRPLAARFRQRNSVIHGDCKINNLLFDTSAESVVAVIDFDTVMYGHWAWDFGDLVRSVCFSLGGADVDYFTACLRGFSELQPQCDARDCAAAPAYVTLMLAVRFLTDHLLNDVYFRVQQHGENLRRAREQFALLSTFVEAQPDLVRAAEEVL